MPHQKVSAKTKREARRLYAGGLSYREVGERLGLAEKTVRNAITDDAVRSNRRALRCLRCDRLRQNKDRPLCYECAYQTHLAEPKPIAAGMTISPWQTLPDGTLMRTVTGI